MNTHDISWEVITHRILRDEQLFPELGGAVSAMIADLIRVRALYGQDRIPDQRLFQLDVQNVAQSLEMLSQLRKADVDAAEMAEAFTDVRALATDMQAGSRAAPHP